MYHEIEKSLTSKIIELQDNNGCWNVLTDKDRWYPEFNYYVPNFKSNLWTLILLADIQTSLKSNKVIKPLKIISNHFFDKQNKIFSLGKSHFPIPCLNGNMLYLLSYFGADKGTMVNDVVDFFAEYQRFDDGDFKTPSLFPYCSNKSCYGRHTCYWGVTKLLKGLSFIPSKKRTKNAKALIEKCIDFILLHEVCYSSKSKDKFIHPFIQYLVFPNMYHSDFLEILWLLKREKVKSKLMHKALILLRNKAKLDNTWKIEKPIKNLIIPIGSRNFGNELITRRAREVVEYYE